MVLGEVKYADSQTSIDTFIKMSRDIFLKGRGYEKAAVTEAALVQYATMEEDVCIYLDYGSPFRLYWIACSQCKVLPIYN